MRHVQKVAVVALLAALVPAGVLLGRHTVRAENSAGGLYSLTWWTVDGGGRSGDHATGGYALSGATGQPDAASWQGAGYILSGGFWPGSLPAGGQGYSVYLPLVIR